MYVMRGVSFACGYLGRAKPWDAKEDYSASDRKFALNLGLPFKTPEMLFLGHDDVDFEWRSIDPTTIPRGIDRPVSSREQQRSWCWRLAYLAVSSDSLSLFPLSQAERRSRVRSRRARER
jgi:hypothetical protein